MKRLVAMEDVRITTGSTYDNAAHLSPDFLKKVRELYEGTRLGRQELQGAMILDPANALFKDDWLIHNDVPEDMIEQVTVGVDPSGGGDEIGIVASALLNDRRFAVLADRSTSGSPAQWGEAVVRCHDDFDADGVVVEVNFGGVSPQIIASSRCRKRFEHYRNEFHRCIITFMTSSSLDA
jgi:phage terminase large subunit-like protein